MSNAIILEVHATRNFLTSLDAMMMIRPSHYNNLVSYLKNKMGLYVGNAVNILRL